jgi:hypothetical protein
MSVSSSFVDHVELRVPLPPAADAVEVELVLRCDDGVALGMLRIIGRNSRIQGDRR